MNLALFDAYLTRIAGIDFRFNVVMERNAIAAKGDKRTTIVQEWMGAFLNNLCVAQDLAVWRGACVALDGAR